jgi:hypothetical protein
VTTDVTFRFAALRFAVGQARAYRQQLDVSIAELAELGAPDLAELREAVSRAHEALAAVDAIGTALLRKEKR